MLDKQGYMQACACARSRAPAHACARAHTQVDNTYCFSTVTMIRERASVSRYTYIVCLLKLSAGKILLQRLKRKVLHLRNYTSAPCNEVQEK